MPKLGLKTLAFKYEKMAYQHFDDLPINLMTAVVVTNMNVNIGALFDQIPVVEYTPPVKRRGRRRKDDPPPKAASIELPEGSVVSMILRTTAELRRRGVTENRTGFKHSLTIQIVVDGRIMCARIPKTGKLHFCGAKSVEQVQKLFTFLVRYICACETPVYELKTLPSDALNVPGMISGMIVIVMRNSNTQIGFSVIRELLRESFSGVDSEWIPRPPNPEKDYPGVSIQRHVPYCGDMPLPVVIIDPVSTEVVETTTVLYDEYVATQTPKNQAKERDGRYVTFLVFADGNMIVTGLNADYLRLYYNEFMQRVCVDIRDQIDESVVQDQAKKTSLVRPRRPTKNRARVIPSNPGTNVVLLPAE